MDEVLTCRDLQVRYGSQQILRGVSFSVAPGEILGIVGQSGSGKSTLLRALMGLLEPTASVTGEVFVAGRRWTGLGEKELRPLRGTEMGLIFQDAGASFCPIRTVGAQILESVAAHRREGREEVRRQALDLFQKLRLQDGQRVWNSYPFQLSGGMNQRLAIAAAMLLHPKVLLADEPTSALDVMGQKQVMEELAQLRKACGSAVILVTHDLRLAAALAENILVLREGAVVEYGPADRVLQAPQAEYTRAMLAAVPRIRRD